MDTIENLLGPPAGRDATQLRARSKGCLEAAKSASDQSLRRWLLERGLELAQRAEAAERMTSEGREPLISGALKAT